MRISLTLVLGLLVAGLLGSPAAGEHGGIHPTFRTESTYFHCNGPSRIYNLNWFAAVGGESAFIPWDTTPPAQSVTDGGGCGGVDVGWTTNDPWDMVFAGTFSGNLRDMTVRLHEVLVDNVRESSTQLVRIYAEVDGVPIFPPGDSATTYEGRAFSVAPQTANSDATALYEFTITNLGYAEEVLDEEGNVVDVLTDGAVTENGDGQRERSIRLLVGIDSFLGEDPPTGTTLWAWDTTEVPSGITFNTASPAAATVAADLP